MRSESYYKNKEHCVLMGEEQINILKKKMLSWSPHSDGSPTLSSSLRGGKRVYGT